MTEAVFRVRAEGGAAVETMLSRIESVAARVQASVTAASRASNGQRVRHYRESADEEINQARAVTRAKLHELVLQGDAQQKFVREFTDAHRRATEMIRAETGRRGELSDREKQQAEELALAMITSHERAERRKTATTRRETQQRVDIARRAAETIAAVTGAVHGATQAPRMEAAQIQATLASALGEGGATASELGGMQQRVMGFAATEGIDPESLARGLQASQQQFSTLAGATPEDRNRALEHALHVAKLAHDTQSNPEELLRLSGALGIGDQGAEDTVLRSAIGVSRRGGVELGSLSAQNLGTIKAQMGAAVANLRRENPHASEADAQQTMISAFTETLASLEVLAPRGLEGRRAGTAVRQLGSALHDPRVQGALRTRLANTFGEHSAEVSQFFGEDGALRSDFMGETGGEAFGRAITNVAGGDPDRIRSLLGRGTHRGDRGEVLHANQRDLLAALAGQDARGRTGWDALVDMKGGAGDVDGADVSRTAAIVQALDATNLTRNRVHGMMSVRDGSTTQDMSDAAADFATAHPMLAHLANLVSVGGVTGWVAKQGGVRPAWNVARNVVQGAGGAVKRGATGLAESLMGAAAVPALATAGAVLSYTGDSVVTGDEESAMLRQYRRTHAPTAPTPPSSARGPTTVELSDRSVTRIADALSRATVTVSQHDAVHATTVAATQNAGAR